MAEAWQKATPHSSIEKITYVGPKTKESESLLRLAVPTSRLNDRPPTFRRGTTEQSSNTLWSRRETGHRIGSQDA